MNPWEHIIIFKHKALMRLLSVQWRNFENLVSFFWGSYDLRTFGRLINRDWIHHHRLKPGKAFPFQEVDVANFAPRSNWTWDLSHFSNDSYKPFTTRQTPDGLEFILHEFGYGYIVLLYFHLLRLIVIDVDEGCWERLLLCFWYQK